MKNTLVVIERPCIQVCLVEHEGLTDEEIFQKALKVDGASQLTHPDIPANMTDDSFILSYNCHEPTDKIVAEYMTKHEYSEALKDIEESKRVVEKPKRTYKRKKKVVKKGK